MGGIPVTSQDTAQRRRAELGLSQATRGPCQLPRSSHGRTGKRSPGKGKSARETRSPALPPLPPQSTPAPQSGLFLGRETLENPFYVGSPCRVPLGHSPATRTRQHPRWPSQALPKGRGGPRAQHRSGARGHTCPHPGDAQPRRQTWPRSGHLRDKDADRRTPPGHLLVTDVSARRLARAGPEGRPFPRVVREGAHGSWPWKWGSWGWGGPGGGRALGMALTRTGDPPRGEGLSRLYLGAHRPSSNTKVRLVWPPPRAPARAPL